MTEEPVNYGSEELLTNTETKSLSEKWNILKQAELICRDAGCSVA